MSTEPTAALEARIARDTAADLELWAELDADPATAGAPIDIATVDIETAADADRALARLARLDRRLAEDRQLAADRIDSAKAWLEQREAVTERARQWHLRAVEGWARAHGRKTVDLPSGTLRLRPARPKVAPLTDPPPDAPAELVRVKTEWARAEIAKHCKPGPRIDLDDVTNQSWVPDGHVVAAAVEKDTGEIVVGVVFLVATDDNFTYKAGVTS